MTLHSKVFRFLHLSIGVFSWLVVAFLQIYFALNIHLSLLNFSSLLQQFIYILLAFAFIAYMVYLNDKVIFYVVRKTALLLHDTPDGKFITTNIVKEITEEGRLGNINWFYKKALYHKVVEDEQVLFSIKETSKEISTKKAKHFAKWSVAFFYLLIILRVFWTPSIGLPLTLRIILSLLPLTIVSFRAFTFYDYPFRIQAKYAKKYNITDWK